MADSTEDPWPGRAMEEYKILQDKIDKIGAFRFTVKGWSITLTGGFVAAAWASGAPQWFPLVLLPFVLAFFLLEREQLALSRRYARLARQIEDAFFRLRLDDADALATCLIPGIATDLAQPAPRPAAKKASTLAQHAHLWWQRVRKATQPEWFMYWAQLIVITTVTIAKLLGAHGQTPGDAAKAHSSPTSQGGPAITAPRNDAPAASSTAGPSRPPNETSPSAKVDSSMDSSNSQTDAQRGDENVAGRPSPFSNSTTTNQPTVLKTPTQESPSSEGNGDNHRPRGDSTKQ